MNNIYVQNIIDNKNKAIYFKDYRWVLHAVYWVYILTSDFTVPIGISKQFAGQLIFSITSCLGIFSFYFLYCFVLVPKLYKRNKYVKFFGIFFISMFLISLLDCLLLDPFIYFVKQGSANQIKGSFLNHYVNLFVLGYVQHFFILSCILYFCESIESFSTDTQIEESIATTYKANRKIENNLWSTNNIATRLDAIEQLLSQQTTDSTLAILHYSQVLRYQLYSTQQSTVTLISELQYIVDYCQMQNKLFKTNIVVETQNAYDVVTMKPLSLFTLLINFIHLATPINAIAIIIVIDEVEVNIAVDCTNIDDVFQNKVATLISTLRYQHTTIIIIQEDITNTQSTINLCIPNHYLIA